MKKLFLLVHELMKLNVEAPISPYRMNGLWYVDFDGSFLADPVDTIGCLTFYRS